MQNVRNRRFNARAVDNVKRMEEIEARVRELIAADERAAASNYALYDGRNRLINLDRDRKKKKGSKNEQAAEEEGEEVSMEFEETTAMALEEEDEHDSSDLDFAAEIEGEMDTAEEEEPSGGESTGLLDDAMADVSIDEHRRMQVEGKEQSSLPPELANLQSQIWQKRSHLATVTNPAVRDRLEEAIRYLEQQLAAKLEALQHP
jgi:TATA-binding protein-associated factor Taf7